MENVIMVIMIIGILYCLHTIRKNKIKSDPWWKKQEKIVSFYYDEEPICDPDYDYDQDNINNYEIEK